MRVKICGITEKEELSTAVNAGADAVGFVNVPIKTPRNVSVEKIKDLINETPPFVTTVLVSMPSGVGEIKKMIKETSPDVVQIHSGLTPEKIEKLNKKTEIKIIRKIEPSIKELRNFENYIDAILIDSSDERGAGGTGKKHNWKKSSKIVRKASKPTILAGGLDPKNVKEAISKVSPYGVDVSSGVENQNRKDENLVREFIKNAKFERL